MRPIRNCARAIIIRDHRILSVKYSDEGGEYFALPGGGQRHGETLPEALVRECQEELGVKVRNLGLRFIREYVGEDHESSWRDADVHQVEFIYECELEPGTEPGMGSQGDRSQVDVAWLPIGEISEYRFYPKTLVDYLSTPLDDVIEYWGNAE
jgi:ADP-ribose pyrophosphatase YjhB (NUDIX family)